MSPERTIATLPATAAKKRNPTNEVPNSSSSSLAISGVINLIDGDWTNLNVHVPAQIALLCALWALRKARIELANTVLLVTATVSISVLVWQNSGLRDPAMLAYPAILAFASTMGGRRLYLSLLAMILLVVALVGVANLQGWHVNAVPAHTLGNLINVSIVLSLTAFLIWLMAPGEKGGSHIIYQRLVRPFFLKHHPVIDKHIRDGKFVDLR